MAVNENGVPTPAPVGGGNGVAMPGPMGSGFEGFQIGQDYSNLAPRQEAPPTNQMFGTEGNNGPAAGAEVGISVTVSAGEIGAGGGSGGGPVSGFDSQAGLVTGTSPAPAPQIVSFDIDNDGM